MVASTKEQAMAGVQHRLAGGPELTKLRAERDGRVVTIWIDDPPRNYISPQLVSELEELLAYIERDQSIRAVILTGAVDGLFSTHYDVPQFIEQADRFGRPVPHWFASAALRVSAPLIRIPGVKPLLLRTPLAGLVLTRQIREVYSRLRRSNKVFIAALNGLVLGAGLELALACDLRVMAAGDYALGLPESALGGGPGTGGGQRLIRLIGPGKAADLLLEGRVIGPEEALEMGIIHRVVARQDLLAEARHTADRLARRPATAVAIAKRGIEKAMSRPLATAIIDEQAGFLHATSQPVAMRALRSYSRQLLALGANRYQPQDMLGRWLDGSAPELDGDCVHGAD